MITTRVVSVSAFSIPGGVTGASNNISAAAWTAITKVMPAMRGQFRPSSSFLSVVGKRCVMRGELGCGRAPSRHG
ncbi:MAG TPA: hypothetical protein VFF93_09085 [Luteimonas sp.]|nr:hypothetical protein [Luteimonas sp.]